MASHEQREAALRDAMSTLVGHPNFEAFIDEIRQQRDVIMEDLCSDTVVKDERLTLATIGELRTTRNIIAIYDDYVARRAMQADSEPVD